ncbi:MAG: Asp-tRNA(Asn)/Glu-tRNA(Gln) amidotransferase subunit GatA, partial [Deltaproteobacteria bacterium]
MSSSDGRSSGIPPSSSTAEITNRLRLRIRLRATPRRRPGEAARPHSGKKRVEHHRKSATQLLALLEAGELSAVSVVTAFLDRIAAVEPRLHAYLHVRDRKALLAEAEAIDERRRRGERVGKLAGLPIAVKDNIATAGIPTTCASRILANFVPPFDATVIRRLRAEGAIILGKTNLDEFAMGSSTENSAFSKTRNPWNPDFVPGGSSGGSAVAVAVDAAAVALGSDTGGSVRQPAAFCGVYGLKPTYGTVSRFGLVAFGSSLDQIGVLGDTVEDCARIFEVIEGHDPNDSTSLPHDPPSVAWKRERKRPQILGWPREYFGEGIDPEVRTALEAARERFADLGYPIETISLPHTPYAIATYYIIAAAEASSNLARYDGVRYGYRSANAGDISRLYLRSRSEGFGSEVKRRIMLGTFVLSSGYYEEY